MVACGFDSLLVGIPLSNSVRLYNGSRLKWDFFPFCKTHIRLEVASLLVEGQLNIKIFYCMRKLAVAFDNCFFLLQV